ncbi:MAG: protein phosphatase CheZ [Nitrospirae bacterium]|nr:protein phosphatase CheZ [Nitrospirota bacterium]
MGLPADVYSEDDDLLKLMRDAKSMTDGDEYVTKVNGRMYGELGGLAKSLNQMVKTLESIERPMQTTASELPIAADQLADLTKFTEEAAHRILGYTEQVLANHDTMAADLAALKRALAVASPDRASLERHASDLESRVGENRKILMDLITAMEFQDLTGQRLKKIATGIREIQSRLLRLLIVFGLKDQNGGAERQEALLSQLEASSKTTLNQNVVDNILQEFGF